MVTSVYIGVNGYENPSRGKQEYFISHFNILGVNIDL